MREVREAPSDSEIDTGLSPSMMFDWPVDADAEGLGLILPEPAPNIHSLPLPARPRPTFRRRAPEDRVFHAKRELPTSYLVTKRVMDFAAALVLLVMLAPVFAIIALAVRSGGGPVFFSQKRVGQGGLLFDCYKFRTMRVDAEIALLQLLKDDPERYVEWRRSQKLHNDPRVTRIGRFLRITSLDELPQIINVLRGEMSLVGPRPIIVSELAKYGPYADHYLSMKPGLTGLWQINGRNSTTYFRRVALDVAYARNASLAFDLDILLRSIAPILTGRGAQ